MAFLTLAFGLGRQARGLSSSIYNTACPSEHIGTIWICLNQLFAKKVASLTTYSFLGGKNSAKVCIVIVLPLFLWHWLIEVTDLPINLKELSVGPEYRGKGPAESGWGHLPLRIFAGLLTLFQSGGHHITTCPLPPQTFRRICWDVRPGYVRLRFCWGTFHTVTVSDWTVVVYVVCECLSNLIRLCQYCSRLSKVLSAEYGG